MIWNEEKDELLCREILVVNVFCGTKRSTVARGVKWEKDAAESEQRVVDDQKKQDRENATDMRKRAMESIGQTKKRKESNDDENEGRKFKKR
ncbi:unnamed protein product, partial [Porites lobata]